MGSSTYRGPGVFSEEIIRSIAPSPLANENIVALVTEVPPTTGFRELITITGTSPVQLAQTGINLDTLQIFTRDEFTQYEAATDYQVTQDQANDYIAHTSIARIINNATETFTLSTGQRTYSPQNGRGVHNVTVSTTDPLATYTEYVDYTYDKWGNRINVLVGGAIPLDGTEITINYDYGLADGEQVWAIYQYGNAEYYSHHIYGDYSEVRSVYGHSWNQDGTPNPVSLAGSLIFANGGPDTQLMVVPVNPNLTSEPWTTELNIADYQLTIDDVIEDEVSMICETSGLTAIQAYVIQHIISESAYNHNRMAILGRDGVNEVVTRQNLRDYGSSVNQQRVVLVSPARWETIDVIGGGTKVIGGQYAACALAGLMTSIMFQETPTRRPVIGVHNPNIERDIVLNIDTTNGLCVIENHKGFDRVRHGTTTYFWDINRREINVVRAKDWMIKSMSRVLDRTVIGMLMEPNADFVVASTATHILERMKLAYVIADYQQPQVYQDTTDPTRLLLQFEYLPNYPVNEILIQFSITPLGAQAL